MHDFTFDGEVTTYSVTCHRCARDHLVSTGRVLDRGDAYAIYYADAHPETSEVFVEVVLDTSWDAPTHDRVAFACRFGPIAGAPPASSLMKPLRPVSELRGRALDRDEAFAHARIDDFWEVCDWILFNDPVSHAVVHALISPPT